MPTQRLITDPKVLVPLTVVVPTERHHSTVQRFEPRAAVGATPQAGKTHLEQAVSDTLIHNRGRGGDGCWGPEEAGVKTAGITTTWTRRAGSWAGLVFHPDGLAPWRRIEWVGLPMIRYPLLC